MKEKTEQGNIAIVLSAGRGSRMQSDVPKQYMDLCGMPVVAWSLKAFQEFDPVSRIILVTSAGDLDYCRTQIVDRYRFDKVCAVIQGGDQRYDSVWAGLKKAAELSGQDGVRGEELPHPPIVFIHDGARPMVDRQTLERALQSAVSCGACVVGMPVKDTIKIADGDGFAQQTPDRKLLWQIQTPQVFTLPLVYESYRKLMTDGRTDVTDDAMVVELESSVRVKLVEGSYRNLKITTPEDIAIARCLLGEIK